ncbi:MAG: sigma-70 family RNA polymerase sigma factor [Planctomycetia bacterium]|nr:sigma-70 family RNA polymerase sigma factor [Planctomycetia bacterium]
MSESNDFPTPDECEFVKNLARCLTHDWHLAEDVASEVNLKFYEHNRHDPIQNRRPWLARVTRTTIIDRARKKTPAALDEEFDPSAEWSLLDENLNEARKYLLTLAPEDREILLLKHQEELSNAKIAEITEKSKSTIGERIHRIVMNFVAVSREVSTRLPS